MTLKPKKPKDTTFSLLLLRLKKYLGYFSTVLLLTVVVSTLSLLLPSQIGGAIDKASSGIGIYEYGILTLLVIGILMFSIVQSIVATLFGELVAKDLRSELMHKVTSQPYQYVAKLGASDLLTRLISDVNNTKQVIAQGIGSILSALLLLVGATTLLVIANWQLGLMALATLPGVVLLFGFTFSKVGPLFGLMQENTTKLNKHINETIFGASTVRVLNSQNFEQQKFEKTNLITRNIYYKVIQIFTILFPTIVFITQIGTLLLLYFGGLQVIQSGLKVGELVTYLSYYSLLSIPIFILGFGTQQISVGLVSYGRIQKILEEDIKSEPGEHTAILKGKLELKDITYIINGKKVLKNISIKIAPKSRVAIVGPTAAGKSQLFNCITGLLIPTKGEVLFDGVPLVKWDKNSLLSQIGLVFQDSIIFNTTVRKNVTFDVEVNPEDLTRALETSLSNEFIDTLTDGLETVISERGGDLSGGQKQRLMLARALVTNPKILLLDDFTARVDRTTEQEIVRRLHLNYPSTTLISIVQSIDSIKDFEQIIVLEEGGMVGSGTHKELLKHNFEYQQIYKSQQTL